MFKLQLEIKGLHLAFLNQQLRHSRNKCAVCLGILNSLQNVLQQEEETGAWEYINLELRNKHFIITTCHFLFRISLRRSLLAERVVIRN